jgi:hypothetical protein
MCDRLCFARVLSCLLVACGGHPPARDAGPTPDAGARDAGSLDAGSLDAAMLDGSLPLEPNIEEALSCATPTRVTGVGNPGELQLHEVDPAIFPDALCNDGTPAVLHAPRRDRGAAADRSRRRGRWP